MNGSRRTFAFIMVCFLIGGFTKVKASSDYDYIGRLSYGVWFTPVRTVKMVADIWIQVFDVPLPDVRVMHNDIQCEDLKGLSAGSLLLRSYKCTCRNLNIFRFQELLAEEV